MNSAEKNIGAAGGRSRTYRSKSERQRERGNGPDPRLEPDDRPEPPLPIGEHDDFVLPIAFSENTLAHLFTRSHADMLVFCHEWGKWLRWENGRWREDHTVWVFDAVRAICAKAGETAIATERSGKRIAAAINRATCISGIERLARHDRRHERHHDDFDADKSLLNTPDMTANTKGLR